jgi:hypothetical protein
MLTELPQLHRFLRLFKEQMMNKVQNKGSSNVRPSPKTFREELTTKIICCKVLKK